MIYNIKKIALFALVATSFTACNLDVIPPSEIAAESFWKTEKDAWFGLNTCYAQLPAMDIWDEMCTDNAHSQKPWEGEFELLQMDGINTNSFNSYNFSTVRIVNNFLEKVEQCEMNDQLRERMKAEARLVRAYAYLDLTNKYGKVPLITTVLAYDAPNISRNSKEEVQSFILNELSEIAEILPQRSGYDGSNMKEKGRITRGAALALRARAALYFGNFAEAEASATKVINEKQYELFRIKELNAAQQKEAAEIEETYIDFAAKGIDKDKFIKGMFSYECLWHAGNASPENPEYILTHEFMADDNNSDYTRYLYIRPSQLVQGYTSYTPMQDLIDAYWDIDGKTIRPFINAETRANTFDEMYKTVIGKDDKGNDITVASADQKTFIAGVPKLDLKHAAYMQEFRNRDSRLYASMLFPFKGWHETDFGTFYYRFFPEKCGGSDTNESWTGYNYRKLVALNPYNDYNSAEDYPIIRYAEVLLTYAEARIQTQGWDETVRTALNDLRDRCGMPNVPISMPGKQEALDFVRNERRIELAAEGHRYDDMRRYGNDYCAKVMSGATYAPAVFNKDQQKCIPYVVVNKKWSSRLLLMPVPQSAIDTNPLLKDDQNPGY